MSLNIPLLRSSFQLVVSRDPELTLRFYKHLFAAHPEHERLFTRNPRAVQAKMLAQALSAVVDKLEDSEWLVSTLRPMGQRHVGYGVTPEMYGHVGAALLATLAEVGGDDWSPELESAWTDAYGAIVGLMLSEADAA